MDEARTREFLSEREVAARLGVGHSTLRRWIATGEVPSVKLGGRRLVPRSWLDALAGRAQ